MLSNKCMQHFFGYTPFPTVKSTPLQFNRMQIIERQYTCEEFNEIPQHIRRMRNVLYDLNKIM